MYKCVFRALAVVCILYYIILCITCGFGVWFNTVWLLGGTLSAAVSFIQNSKARKVMTVLLLAVIVVSAICISPIVNASRMEPEKNAKYLIVLGAEVKPDNSPSNVLYHRLMSAYDYYQENPDVSIIVSGCRGYNENISEARCMEDFLMELGVSKEKIILDEDARNTYENILNAKKIIGSGDQITCIATSEFHIYRSLRLAKKLGFEEISAVPSHTMKILLPNYYLREAAACFKDFTL